MHPIDPLPISRGVPAGGRCASGFCENPADCPHCATGLSSPPSPTSPKNAMSAGNGRSAKLDAMASATATSVDGSSSFIPPTMFTKTSCW